MLTATMAPRLTKWVRMRPTVENETLDPSRRSKMAILRLPHIGLSWRRSSTARTSSCVLCLPRGQCGRRLKGSGFFSQR